MSAPHNPGKLMRQIAGVVVYHDLLQALAVPPGRKVTAELSESSRFAENQKHNDNYYTGGLSAPQMDPAAQPFNPRVPSLFITRGGDALLLQRGPTGEIPPATDSKT
jgi:hypothetical protein